MRGQSSSGSRGGACGWDRGLLSEASQPRSKPRLVFFCQLPEAEASSLRSLERQVGRGSGESQPSAARCFLREAGRTLHRPPPRCKSCSSCWQRSRRRKTVWDGRWKACRAGCPCWRWAGQRAGQARAARGGVSPAAVTQQSLLYLQTHQTDTRSHTDHIPTNTHYIHQTLFKMQLHTYMQRWTPTRIPVVLHVQQVNTQPTPV